MAAVAATVPARAFAIPSEDRLIALAKRELERHSSRVWLRDKVGIVDFSMPSKDPRFFLVDLENGTTRSYFVTHGRGSDPEHDGWLKSFSNQFSSNASSRGAYVTQNYYEGKHGLSMRLQGLDPDNNNAEDRAIVVHGAAYANPDMITKWGKLGRSEGCFAFPQDNLVEVIARIGPQRLLFADRLE
ncbi:MAG: murein L,D-transpeptidase catalytic domain family protein [Chakrabartia sp.]